MRQGSESGNTLGIRLFMEPQAHSTSSATGIATSAQKSWAQFFQPLVHIKSVFSGSGATSFHIQLGPCITTILFIELGWVVALVRVLLYLPKAEHCFMNICIPVYHMPFIIFQRPETIVLTILSMYWVVFQRRDLLTSFLSFLTRSHAYDLNVQNI